MKLELLGSWSFKKSSFCSAGGLIGAHLADGTFEVRRGVVDLPVVASLSLPKGANVALAPSGERLAYAVGSTITLAGLDGKPLETARVDEGVAVTQVEFRKDGRRLWVFGQSDDGFHAYAFDRDLKLDGKHRLDIDPALSPSVELLHPTKDDFVLLTSPPTDDPDEATTGRTGVVTQDGALRIAFEDPAISHPCVDFTPDGTSLIGVDFIGTMLYRWPDYTLEREVLQPEGYEGGLGGIVVGSRLLTERHDEEREQTTSHLLVLSLPTFEEVATFPWNARGPFAKRKDNAGLDLSCALGADSFLELSPGAKGVWTCRAWRLV